MTLQAGRRQKAGTQLKLAREVATCRDDWDRQGNAVYSGTYQGLLWDEWTPVFLLPSSALSGYYFWLINLSLVMLPLRLWGQI